MAIQERLRKTKAPCDGCYMHADLCICDFLPSLNLKTRVCLVIHAKELKRTTNTGRLAVRALKNSEMRVRGERGSEQDLSDLLTDQYRTFLFYPSDDAVELNRNLVEQDSKPIQLIVPDGNWRQASKVHYRHDELKNVVRVKTRPSNPATQFLRTESKTDGMATLQAIAEALGVIEGDEVKNELLDFYNLKLQRTLKARGVKIDAL